MRSRVLWSLVLVGMAAQAAAASDGILNWAYQPTGFPTYASGRAMQTALAMQDGRAWPVIFSPNSSMMVQAYSLSPVQNPLTGTNWQQIGVNLLRPTDSNFVLSAATSSDGRVGAVVRSMSNPPSSAAVVGAGGSGFGAPMTGVVAIDFDSHGNLVKGTMNTIPLSVPAVPALPTPQGLVDIAVSPTGDLGAFDLNGCYYQQSAITGTWGGVNLGPQSTIATPYADLAMDSIGRPHLVAPVLNSGSSYPALAAYDFDIMSGQWQSQTLSAAPLVSLPTIATDSHGDIGVAWVQGNTIGSTSFTLMYAEKDGINGWTSHAVASSVYNPLTHGYDAVSGQMKVGSAFDANDFPVISFVAGTSNKIWLAYDPPPALPGDANRDGTVDLADLAVMLTNIDKTGLAWSQGDFNGDGAVDMADLSQLLANFDKSASAAGHGINAVPEPGALAILATGLVGLLVWRRKQ